VFVEPLRGSWPTPAVHLRPLPAVDVVREDDPRRDSVGVDVEVGRIARPSSTLPATIEDNAELGGGGAPAGGGGASGVARAHGSNHRTGACVARRVRSTRREVGMSRLRVKLAIGVAVLGVAATTAAAVAGDRMKLRTSLSGYEEVPAVSTTGGGEFRAAIDRDSDTIQYEITYHGMEGTVTQSHIHFAQEGVNGGITHFLCSNLGNGPAGTPACPQEGTVTGTITPETMSANANVVAQGLTTGEFDELVRALRAGAIYANVHSTTWPGGEIRGQIENRQDD
jgi:hypothetical protein